MITSRQNETIRQYRELVRNRKSRYHNQCFVIEGENLCRELLASGGEPIDVLFTSKAREKYCDLYMTFPKNTVTISISDEIGEYISDTKAPQGIFCRVPFLDKTKNMDTIIQSGKKIILLDNLQDTGNFGTIIRSAEAFGIDAVIASPDCPDMYSPKVVRGAMGSLFRLPVAMMELELAVSMLKKADYTVYAAMLSDNARVLSKDIFHHKNAVIIGNEGNGITLQHQALCDHSVFIPISGAQSLNAAIAAAIIMWEM